MSRLERRLNSIVEELMIPYGKQSISRQDIDAVVESLGSDFLTTGPRVEAFEKELAERVGVGHAVVVNSGTSALHLAMMAGGIGVGDRVVTSPITFLASANCAAYVGATPDFADVDEQYHNLCPQALKAGWKSDTKAVVGVDYAGNPCDWPGLASVAREHGALLIEDACHAIGGRFLYQGEEYNIGGHPWADATCFSFHPVKTVTTAEGGALVTNNEEFAAKARMLRNHGMVRDAALYKGDLAGDNQPWYYEMQDLGFNFRISDLQCALGSSQLQRLDEFIERRRDIVARYNEAFAGIDALAIPACAHPELTSWHLYVAEIDFEALDTTRGEFMEALLGQGVGSQVHYIPVHLQPYYRDHYGYGAGKCPIAESFYERCLSLPLFPAMSDSDVEHVIEVVSKTAG